VLVREGAEGPEVLLRHRPGQTPLGRVGFPGGSLMGSDGDSCAWFGPGPVQWSAALGIHDRRRVRQHVVAAVRELFEESGVLLAGRSEGEIVADARGDTWGGSRSSLEEGGQSLPALLSARGLGLRADLLRPLSRWHSAPHSHRRFDTVVFAAALPEQQVVAPRPGGQGLQAWLPARHLLDGPLALPGPEGWMGEAGEIALDQVSTPMTQLIVRRIARHRTAAAFLLSLTGGVGGTGVPELRVLTEADEDGAHVWMRAEELARG